MGVLTKWGRKKRIGLALGGGAARGWAHLGVLDALNELGIKVDVVAGTSIGAIVGGFYAAGRVAQLRELALQLDWMKVLYYFFEVGIPRSGLVDGRRIVDLVRHLIGQNHFDALEMPFRAVATDILTGAEAVLKDGDLIEAIRASFAIPGVFSPVKWDGAFLVDGGLVNPVPVSVTRAMGADVVIAVDLNHDIMRKRQVRARSDPVVPVPPQDGESLLLKKFNPLIERFNRSLSGFNMKFRSMTGRLKKLAPEVGILDVIGNTILIAESQITKTRLLIEPPDILIRPEVGHIMFMEFHRAQEALDLGYEAALASLRESSLFH